MSLKSKVLAAAATLTLIGGFGAAEPSVPAAALADADHCGRRAGPRSAHARARDRIGYLAAHFDGGQQAMADLRRYQAAQQAQTEDEMARGPRKHHRLPRWIGHVPKLVLLIDFGLLLYFFSGITDVGWASPLSANLAFAVLLAAMVTTLSCGFFAYSGYQPRGYKDHSRAIISGVLASAYALSRPRALEYVTDPLAAHRGGPRSTATIGRRAGLLSVLTVGFAGPRSSRSAPGTCRHARAGHRIVQPGWTG